MITCITPTGDRPQQIALCNKYMMHQTVQPDQWIVMDDGKVESRVSHPKLDYIRRIHQNTDSRHTHGII